MSQMSIEISDQQRCLAVDHDWLRGVVTQVLREEGISTAELSVALVDDAAIHEVNRSYLGHDYPTDVISFVLSDTDDGSLDGELVVSVETAVREAPRHEWAASDEVLLYVVHGLLHLCGYDDLTDEARPRMRARERDYLALWNLTPTGLEA